jgi:uncharacterized RDD family membrane protein YckC
MKKVFSETGEWECPKCRMGAWGYRCARCSFDIYAGFLPRFYASVADGLITWVCAFLFLNFRCHSLESYWAVTIFGFFFYRFYHIVFVAWWGQTPGKILARIKVVRLDGSPARWTNALLRNSVETLLAAMVYFLELQAVQKVSPAVFAAAANKDGLVLALIPPLAIAIAVASKLYVLSELVVLWFNPRRRAIHDFIAGTVVVHDPRMPLLPWTKRLG